MNVSVDQEVEITGLTRTFDQLRYNVKKVNSFILYLHKVPAGFPSPADDYIEDKLSLDEILIKHPSATFLVKVCGNSMVNEGIHDNDLLIVDRSLTPADGKVVVAVIDGEITVKKLKIIDGTLFLMPANPRFKPIEIKEGSDVMVWGVVKSVIHDL